jgi:hypothetical protein
MRYIHPAAWAGLILNGTLIFAMFSMLADLQGLTPSEINGVDPVFLEALGLLQPIAFLLLALQAAAVGLIASRFKAGIVLAAVVGAFMLPAGFVYLIGCMLSHYRVKYAAFTSSAAYSQAQVVFPSAAAATLPYLAAAGFALVALCIAAKELNMGIMLLGLSLTGLYLSMRARKFYALSLHQSCFTVTPGLFVDPLEILYSTVQTATLNDDESIRFTIETKPDKTLVLVWSLQRVEKKSRREALENLGNALAAHHVPLY